MYKITNCNTTRRKIVDTLKKFKIEGQKIGRKYYYDKGLIESKLEKIREKISRKAKKNS